MNSKRESCKSWKSKNSTRELRNHELLEIQWEHNENHENHGFQYEKHENHENLRMPTKNNENH